MPKTTFMAFCAEAPLVGLDPQPGWAPDEVIESFDAEGYAKALHANDDRSALEREAREDHQARQEAYEAGDLEDVDDIDMVFEVTIHDDGRVEVIHDDPRYVFASFTVAEAYEAFGMSMPIEGPHEGDQ